eukprot:g4145.t1
METRIRFGYLALILVGLFPATALSGGTLKEGKERSLSELEDRVTEIDAEIENLASPSLRSGIGSIGYRSTAHQSPDSPEWVEVSLGESHTIDQIVLVPTLWRESKKGFQADGFPESFRIYAGTDDDREGEIIAEYSRIDQLLPRISPVVVPIAEVSASWIRVEAIRLTPRAFDGGYVFQLSELMVFSGARNVALRRPVKASTVHIRDLVHAWDPQFLVDGHMPYLMDAALGEPSVPYIGSVRKHQSLILDLESEYPVSEIHLHTVDQSDTVPQAYPGNLGIPPYLLIEGSNTPDFSKAVTMRRIHSTDFTDTGPSLMWPLPETKCRYVRIRSGNPVARTRFGFAEIEVYANDENVALGKKVFWAPGTNFVDPAGRSLAALTDGRNLYGEILPLKQWMNELARNHDLEAERPLIVAELNRRYSKQKRNLQIMSWIAAVLAAVVGFVILIDRMLRMRQAARIRERFAADLHDELGANIHTIGLLGDLAREAESREELLELLDRSRMFTERSGLAIVNCTNMLEAKGLCEDLLEEMRRAARSLLADLGHEIRIEGRDHLRTISQRKRIDIFFFYKECLTNIIRHSGATAVTTELQATAKSLTLTITDNGHGLEGQSPSSLKRRARLLGGKLMMEDVSDGSGTRIQLKNIELISQFGTAEIALREIQNARPGEHPDLVLLDLNLPGISGLESIPWIRKYSPKSKIIVLTQSNKEADVLEAISKGASGYLLKSATATQIKESIEIVNSGGASLDPSVAKFILNTLRSRPADTHPEKTLSTREMEVLTLLGEGLLKKEIANRLDIGFATVAYHIKHIYEKLEVQNAAAAVAKGYRSGLL